jgi:hypothetical protein
MRDGGEIVDGPCREVKVEKFADACLSGEKKRTNHSMSEGEEDNF